MPSYKIPVIAGPTASGKTAVAVELCRRIGGEIISADSMQVYRHLSVGTAKPTPDELLGIPCHLIDHVNPDEQYHMGRFVDEALRCIDEIRERGNVPVICGGTGLYIKGLLYGIFHGGETDMTVRTALEDRMEKEGLPVLFEELRRVELIRHRLLYMAQMTSNESFERWKFFTIPGSHSVLRIRKILIILKSRPIFM